MRKMAAYILLNCPAHAHACFNIYINASDRKLLTTSLSKKKKNTQKQAFLSQSTSPNIPRGSFPHRPPIKTKLYLTIKALVSASMGMGLMLVCKLPRAPPLREKTITISHRCEGGPPFVAEADLPQLSIQLSCLIRAIFFTLLWRKGGCAPRFARHACLSVHVTPFTPSFPKFHCFLGNHVDVLKAVVQKQG